MEKDRAQKPTFGSTTICINMSIKWIAEKVDAPEEIMRWAYTKSEPDWALNLPLAEAMRKAFPDITDDILKGNATDVKLIVGETLVLATPPRVYNDWAYDFLKSDICVTGPKDKEPEMVAEFEKEKERSLRRKAALPSIIAEIKPGLDRLADEHIIDGLIGRGSYFDKNGFPLNGDNVNFILLFDKPFKEYDMLDKILKEVPKFAVGVVRGKHIRLKEGAKPEIDFIVVDRDMAIHSTGIKYNKYVLENGVGIALHNLPGERSEDLARVFSALLPKYINRDKYPRLPPTED
jgi:hypothetical protein